jgi:hypothetical protein
MSESPGTLIGLSNVLTASKARPPAGADPDADAGLRDRLHVRSLRALEGREAFIHDAVIHGHRVRLYTNSHHLADFWRDHWPTEAEWLRAAGRAVLHAPVLTVYAIIHESEESEAAYVSGSGGEVYLFNTSFYGALRAATLDALARNRHFAGIRLVHGGMVEIGDRGVALNYPVEVIHPTPVWGLMENPGTRFLAEGWFAVEGDGQACALEKQLYVRTSLVASYPKYEPLLRLSKFENVPDPTPALIDRGMAAAQPVVEYAAQHPSRAAFAHLPPEKAREIAIRLTASDDSRVLVAPAALFGKSRIAAGPVTPAVAFALRAGRGETLRPAPVEPFTCAGYELHVGSVAGPPLEVARLIARTAAP